MSLSAAALRIMAEKGLSALDIAEIAEAMDVRRDPTAAERQQRRRDKVKAEQQRDASRRDVTRDAPPNDIYSNPPEPQSANADCTPLAETVVSAWNEIAPKAGLPLSRTLNPKRKTALRARAKEHGPAAVFDAIRGLAGSPFHCGQNDRGWKADLGWLLNSPEHFQKMLERVANAPAAKPVDASTLEERAAFKERMGQHDDAEDLRRQASLIRDDHPPPRRESTARGTSVGDLVSRIHQDIAA